MMHKAHNAVADPFGAAALAAYAAEIRAIAEWIEQRQVEDYAVTLPDVREVIGWLTAEADRAENNDVPTKQEPQ